MKPQERAPLLVERIQRLKDAIEGECDGLAITTEHAEAILQYVDESTAQAPAPDYHESTNAAWKTALSHPTESSAQSLQRPAIEDRADAERYRWLRAEVSWEDAGDGDFKWAFWVPMGMPDMIDPLRCLDAAIDAAMKDQA